MCVSLFLYIVADADFDVAAAPASVVVLPYTRWKIKDKIVIIKNFLVVCEKNKKKKIKQK